MNKKIISILVVVLIIIAGGVFYFQYHQQLQQVNIQNNTSYPQSSNFAFYPIPEIKLNKFNSGTYNAEVYVVKIYMCPPCPKGAQCKPCMRDNIVISENNQLLETYSLSGKEMILFANNSNQFELGKKYQFSIKILDYKSTGEPINDVEIVGYNLLSQNVPANPPTIAPFAGNLSCKEMYSEIENDIDNANYCKTDSDCDVLMLGGWYVDFGCYHFVNKNVDKDQFYKKMDIYKQQCSQIINDCAAAPDARCVSNKCVFVGQE